MADSVKIRMYQVGLGDSFLLRFPDADRERKVLIDCGVHPSGPGPHKISEVVDQIIEDCTEDDGECRIDVVVATHRHRDHVLGFESERWKNVHVDEVWMPWTEDPADPEARKILERQAKKAKRLAAALRAARADSKLLEIAENSLTNATAMATLHHGFLGVRKRRYLPQRKRTDQTFETTALPGVTVHAMGPSRDPEVIRDMNPPANESYLRLGDVSADGEEAAPPFASRWLLSPSGAAFGAWQSKLAEKAAGLPARPDGLRPSDADFLPRWYATLGLRERDFSLIDETAEDDPFALVVSLDSAVNGTSLMLMFQIGSAFLLFPGDAQWGTWKRAMEDEEWEPLLRRTNFLKVGHHGSHNATPKHFVKNFLPDDFSGMICTRNTKKFKEIPREPLVRVLRKKSHNRIARSDETKSVKGFRRKEDRWTDTTVSI